MEKGEEQSIVLHLMDWKNKEEGEEEDPLIKLLQFRLLGKFWFSHKRFHHVATIGNLQSYAYSTDKSNDHNLYWPTWIIVHKSMILIADNGYSRINIFDYNTRKHLCCFRIPKQSPEQLIAHGDYLIISSAFRVFSLNLTEKLRKEPLDEIITEQELRWNLKFEKIINRMCFREEHSRTVSHSFVYVGLESGQIIQINGHNGEIVSQFQILDPFTQSPFIPNDLTFSVKTQSFFLLDTNKKRIVSFTDNHEITSNFMIDHCVLHRSLFYDEFRNLFYICTNKSVNVYNSTGFLIRTLLDGNVKGQRFRNPDPLQICLPSQSIIYDNHLFVVDYDHHRILLFNSD